MKQLSAILLLAICAALAACGSGSSGSNAGNVNGTWNASLSEANNQAYGSLGLNMVTNNDGTLTVTNLTINGPVTGASPCFASPGSTATGSFSLSGNFSGSVTGQFSMTVQSGSASSGNTLKLTGSANGNTISGTWNVTGQFGCTGNGTFTMTKM